MSSDTASALRTASTGRRRAMLAIGALLVAGCALTTAALTDSADVVVTMDGSQNRFDIQVAGAYGDETQAWSTDTARWDQGNPDAYQIGLGSDDNVLAPGAHIDGKIAVRNESPRLDGILALAIVDPLPRGDALDPQTGRHVELFDQLLFTVSEGDIVLFDRVPAAELTTYTWPDLFASGDEKVLDVSIEMSEATTNLWQSATTDVQFQFEAVTP